MMQRNIRDFRALCAALLLLSLCSPLSFAAADETPRHFSIAGQSLQSALNEFARQSDRQILFSTEVVDTKVSHGVQGNLAPETALRQLLRGTGLGFRVTTDNTILVEAVRAGDTASLPPTHETIRLVQAGGVRSDQEDAPPPEGTARPPARTEISESVVVTGTHIRGNQELPSPTLTVSRLEFEDSGFVTVQDLFEQLPQNFDGVTQDGRFANEGGGFVAQRNNERATAIDLRGLGPQSTLTLVDGMRRAGSVSGRIVDISAIPLSVVERVEIVTDGRSSIYGSDAVGGVVNLVTRSRFDGLESQLQYGWAEDGGGEQLQASVIGGASSARGSFVAAFDYAEEDPFRLNERGLMSLQPVFGITFLELQSQSAFWRHTGYLAGNFSATDSVELYGQALLTSMKHRDFELENWAGATQDTFFVNANPSDQYSAALGARIGFASDWQLDISAATSTADNQWQQGGFLDAGFVSFPVDYLEDINAEIHSARVIADGALPAIGNVTPRAAFGIEYREESLDFRQVDTGFEFNSLNKDRTVSSAFAEFLIPLVDDGDRRFEVSVAGRYDDYDDFGDTTNPHVGVLWSPNKAVTMRASYATAFRAPALIELGSTNFALLQNASDPQNGGANSPVLFIQGDNANLGPEEADTWSAGVDFRVGSGTTISIGYFNVDYTGRIEQPTINADRPLVLQRADRFPGLINRNPTAAEAAAILALDSDGFISNSTGTPFNPATDDILAVFPNLITFDNRTANIAVEQVDGLDFRIDSTHKLTAGDLTFGANASYMLGHDRSVTATSPSFELLNEVGKPVDFRARVYAGWTRGAYGAKLYLNYADGYTNPFSAPVSGMDSFTTVDLSFRFDGSDLASSGFLDGFTAVLSVQNLLDEDPPLFPNSLQGVLYDTANASPVGRFVAIQFVKAW
jgi:outer membrane cobalamin receptor